MELNQRVAGTACNSTLIVLVSGHHDISLHSPPYSPGVLDQPVVFTFVCSVTNDKDPMVQPNSTTGAEMKKGSLHLFFLERIISLWLVASSCDTLITTSSFPGLLDWGRKKVLGTRLANMRDFQLLFESKQ